MSTYHLPPLHREWLVALLDDLRDHDDENGQPHMGRPQDIPWAECEVRPKSHRRSLDWTACPYCRARVKHAKTERQRRKQRQRMHLSMKYITVPPALRAASEREDPIAYWIGRCLHCNQVMWAADDGKPAEATA